MTVSTHVVVIGNQAETMVRFRGSLLALLVARGIKVTAVCPLGTNAEHRRLADLRVDHVPIRHLKRSGVNPVSDLRLVAELATVLGELRPTHVMSYFLKPSIYGALAARWAKVPRSIASIEGLGFSFTRNQSRQATIKQGVARSMVTSLLRISMRLCDKILVMNSDDAEFIRHSCHVPGHKIAQIDGIGVDLNEFQQADFSDGPIEFCLAARLIREKGIFEFIEAARIVKKQCTQARFVLLGDVDDNPGAIKRAEVDAWAAEGLVIWPGKVDDVRPYLKSTSVFVLPSYREGLPRSIMEAMAMGRSVITTDVPGCRASVTDGVSGMIVPAGDGKALASAMMRYVADPSLVVRLGRSAAVEARRRFDSRHQDALIAAQILADCPQNGGRRK